MEVSDKADGVVERVAKRISARKKTADSVTLTQSNTYIFPTAQGVGFLVLLLLMLVAAINYQNSLVYTCLFFLGAIFFVSIWSCFLNVSGLEVFTAMSEGAFEGKPVLFKIGTKRARTPIFGLQVGFDSNNMRHVAVEPGVVQFHELVSPPLKRGRHTIPRIRIESTYPFGFIRAWAWITLSGDVVVYPTPEYIANGAGGVTDSAHGARRHAEHPDKDVLRQYLVGEPLNRVLWKKYAAINELVVRDSDTINTNTTIVSWYDYLGHDKEARLRFMCYRVCDLYEQGLQFGILLPLLEVAPDYSKPHLEKCLTALAEA